MRPVPITPKPGQESVWDYPRPPRIEPVNKRIRIALGGKTIVDTTNDVLRVLETSHPPVYYVAITDVLEGILRASTSRTTFCEFKGVAHYYNVANERDAAWGYVDGLLKGHIAFYASRMDACFVDDERVTPQPGVFYGGWITSDIVGPFKGEPGTQGW